MHESVRDAFLPFSEPLEGRVHFMYLDVKSLVSTGVGNLLDADNPSHFGSNPHPLPDIFTLDWFDKGTGAPASHSEIEAEYETVKFSGTAGHSLDQKEAITRLRITDQTIDGLVMRKLSSFETTLRGRPPFAGLDDWPADGQLGLFSMAWAMGPMFHFPNFQAAAANGDWLTMARECRMTEAGNPGVIPRNVRNGLLFTLKDDEPMKGSGAARPPARAVKAWQPLAQTTGTHVLPAGHAATAAWSRRAARHKTEMPSAPAGPPRTPDFIRGAGSLNRILYGIASYRTPVGASLLS